MVSSSSSSCSSSASASNSSASPRAPSSSASVTTDFLEPALLLPELLGLGRVVPDVRRLEPQADLLQALFPGIVVKDTP